MIRGRPYRAPDHDFEYVVAASETIVSVETAKLSRMALIAMVVGSMVGAGIFSLPSVFSRYTGPQGGLLAWAIAGTGMLTLAMVFQFLARRRPDLDSGIFAYAKAGFGRYIGFLAALGYWTAACLGNVSRSAEGRVGNKWSARVDLGGGSLIKKKT